MDDVTKKKEAFEATIKELTRLTNRLESELLDGASIEDEELQSRVATAIDKIHDRIEKAAALADEIF